MRRTCWRLVCLGILIAPAGTVCAGEPAVSDDLARAQLVRVLAVLQAQPKAAGGSCLDALQEVHRTEDQVKILQNKANNPDLALAQDVLETDYENAKEICGADATRSCQTSGETARLSAACARLHGDK